MSKHHSHDILCQNGPETLATVFSPSEYTSHRKNREVAQSEEQMEKEFINVLVKENGYEYLDIKDTGGLLKNLRAQLEKLNRDQLTNGQFTDGEWKRYCDNYLLDPTDDTLKKITKFQRNPRYNLTLDSGEEKNILIVDKEHLHRNHLQVINQYAVEGKAGRNVRYDVTILLNGIPVVHIELKKRDGNLENAFNQINRYQRDSFDVDGLYQYVHIFVVSTGIETKYYANTVDGSCKSVAQTSYWSLSNNDRISDIDDFSRTFFTKRTLLNLLIRYSILKFTVPDPNDKVGQERKDLVIMRPYQIVAVEQMMNKVKCAIENNWMGSKKAGGYIWHTTGSGKTVTSFKAAQLLSKIDGVNKVIFVVDRQDLDTQTIKEYNNLDGKHLDSGSSNDKMIGKNAITRASGIGGTSNARGLVDKLNNPQCKIIVTTIQKLARVVKYDRYSVLPAFKENTVIVFDECHRSQFGDMHKMITKRFKKHSIFGFTGTPIKNKNIRRNHGEMLTTDKIFGDCLHIYTIKEGIRDKNVLPFKVDYRGVYKTKDGDISTEMLRGVDAERTYRSPERIKANVARIRDEFSCKTYGGHYNSILATASIEAAIAYYQEFKRAQENNPRTPPLKVAMIYTYSPNSLDKNSDDYIGSINDGSVNDEADFTTDNMPKQDRDALEDAIQDYNKIFGQNYDAGSSFKEYFKDVAERLKDRDLRKRLDILIVVDMFLTGFDAKTLNTLWVDKPLRYHGLLQAFSRTNRVFNKEKSCGQIVCFRNIYRDVENSIALYGDKDASGVVLMRSFEDYYYGFISEKEGEKEKGYLELMQELRETFPRGCNIDDLGEAKQKDFLKLWSEILRARNILKSFTEFEESEAKNDARLQEGERIEYQGTYGRLWRELMFQSKGGRVDISQDLVYEADLVRQDSVNMDYIMALVEKYRKQGEEDQKETLIRISNLFDGSPEIASKKELIEKFLAKVNIKPSENLDDVKKSWKEFLEEERTKDLDKIIDEQGLKPDLTRKFMDNALKRGSISLTGAGFFDLMPGRISMFMAEEEQNAIRDKVEFALMNYWDKYSK